MTRYVFVDDDGYVQREITVEAETEKEARKKSWALLTDEEKDACGLWGCVDEINV